MPTVEDLAQLQKLPLEYKVLMTKARIREWVAHYGENGVYVSFSGGKDSTVLLHLVREEFPNVEAVFVNTGLEYPEIQKFARSFDNVTVLRPKVSFRTVLETYGYAIVSKEVSQTIAFARRNIADGKLDTVRVKKMMGEITRTKAGKSRYNHELYKPLLDVDFLISDHCCDVMKKAPTKEYGKRTGKKPFIATMTDESSLRKTEWLRHGCNSFEGGKAASKPMSFWTEQDVLHYIKKHNISMASVYGDIVPDAETDGQLAIADELVDLRCTGCERTGCIFCLFGAHLEKGEGRFERLKRTHPRQYEYCMEGGGYDVDGLWKPNDKGLGLKHVIDVFNELYPKMKIRY